MPRRSVDISNEDFVMIEARAKAESRTIASMLRCLISRQLHVGILIENGAKGRKMAQSDSNQQSPTHARAGYNLFPEEEKDPDLNTPPVGSKALEAFERLNWYGAKLPKDDTPTKFMDRASAAFPAVDLVVELTKASQWIADNPVRRKKRLGMFLMSWFGRSKNDVQPAGYTRQRHAGSPGRANNQAELDQMDFMAGTDNHLFQAEIDAELAEQDRLFDENGNRRPGT